MPLLLLAAAVLGACSNATPRDEIVNITLNATQRNAGRIGSVTLAPYKDTTSMNLFISAPPYGTTRPLRLYTYIYPGPCAHRGDKPAYELNDTVITYHRDRLAGWTLYKTAPVPLSTLRAGDYSIWLRTTPADGNWDIFCGDIH